MTLSDSPNNSVRVIKRSIPIIERRGLCRMLLEMSGLQNWFPKMDFI